MTDRTFQKHGVPMPGIPFLADSNGCLMESANDYLFHIAAVRGRTRAPNTWRTYAEHLYEFYAFLESNRIEWNQVELSHMAAWRGFMLDRGLARVTVNQRVRGVSAFYIWCRRKGLIARVPFTVEDVSVNRPQGALSHLDASGSRVSANELTLRTMQRLPKFLPLEQATTFVLALSPARMRLIALLMLVCGLRREEAAGLDVRVLPSPAGRDPSKAIRLTLDPALTPTKGARARWVSLPYRLAGQLFDYQWQERPILHKRYKNRYGEGTTKLFLTHNGEPLSLEGVSDCFRKCSKRTGISCTPHTLRHTFAVHELARMSGRPKINALCWVRDRLGHASITTTEIYLKAADLVTHDEMDGFIADLMDRMSR